MDKGASRLPTSRGPSLRVVPQLDKQSSAASANRGRKQFRPNVNLAAADDKNAAEQSLDNISSLADPKQEALADAPIERKRPARPPRGFDRVSSIFESGVGQNAPSIRPGFSVSRNSSDGPHSARARQGVNGAQENFGDTMGDFQTTYDGGDVSASAAYDNRGALDPITPFNDGKLLLAEDPQRSCASLVFDKDDKSPLLFQIPIGSVIDANLITSGPVKLGRLQRLKSGKMRLVIPVINSAEQEVPNQMESILGSPTSASRPFFQSLELSFASSSVASSPALNQIICVHSQQSSQTATSGVKSEPNAVTTVTSSFASANRPASIPSMSSNLFVLGKVAARISSSVNL